MLQREQVWCRRVNIMVLHSFINQTFVINQIIVITLIIVYFREHVTFFASVRTFDANQF